VISTLVQIQPQPTNKSSINIKISTMYNLIKEYKEETGLLAFTEVGDGYQHFESKFVEWLTERLTEAKRNKI